LTFFSKFFFGGGGRSPNPGSAIAALALKLIYFKGASLSTAILKQIKLKKIVSANRIEVKARIVLPNISFFKAE
jgi:hypothetical protein